MALFLRIAISDPPLDCAFGMIQAHSSLEHNYLKDGFWAQNKNVAPSAVPSPIYRHMPKEMTAEDIKRVKEDFADAAARCRAWGADGVAVNCSAGYLLSLFLSGETNQRTDEYGGSQENRFRFPLEVRFAWSHPCCYRFKYWLSADLLQMMTQW